jgi:hypothetical protein
MGGANGSSLVATTNPYSGLLVAEADDDDDDDDDDGDGDGGLGWAGAVETTSRDRQDPALPGRPLGDGRDGARVGDAGALLGTCHVAHDGGRLGGSSLDPRAVHHPSMPRLMEDDGDDGWAGDVEVTIWSLCAGDDLTLLRLLDGD